jgi:hypothetical protein
MLHKLLFDAINARLDALETAAGGRPRRRLSKTQLAEVEGCSPREVMRRVARKALPPPDDIINGRLFWWSDSIEDHRRKHTRAEADSPEAKAARDPRLRVCRADKQAIKSDKPIPQRGAAR